MKMSSIPIESITLEETMLAFEQWRSNKPNDGGQYYIPQTLWDKVFALEAKGLPARSLKSALGLSSTQYRNQKLKREQNAATPGAPSNDAAKPAIFTEAVVSRVSTSSAQSNPLQDEAAKATRHQVKQLRTMDSRSHEPDLSTVIVECIHRDGHRLKIHATNERVSEIFNAFLAQSSDDNQPC